MYYIDSNASMVRVRNMDLYLLGANKCFKLGILKKILWCCGYLSLQRVIVGFGLCSKTHLFSDSISFKSCFFCTCDSIALNMVLNLLKTVILYLVYIELNHHVIMSKQTNIFITLSDFTDAADNNIPENNQGRDLKYLYKQI